MIPEIEYCSKPAEMRQAGLLLLALNLFFVLLAIFYLMTLLRDQDMLSMIALLAFIFLLLDILVYMEIRDFLKDISDTLHFTVRLDKGDFRGNTDLYNSIVKLAEDHLVRNRITFEPRLEGHKFGGHLVPYSKAFHLGAYGLTLKVRRGKGVAHVLFGPVSGPGDPVARRLLEGLRQELLRSETSAPPEKKG